jgi:hypothetical protein
MILQISGKRSMAAKKLYGKYRGVVLDIAEDRLSVSVPAALGSMAVWADICLPVQMGLSSALPPVGTAVWIEFEGGSLGLPLCTGRILDQADPPSPAAETILRTPSGANITITQTPDGGVALSLGAGGTISLSPEGIVLDNGRGASVTLKGPTVSINAGALAVT